MPVVLNFRVIVNLSALVVRVGVLSIVELFRIQSNRELLSFPTKAQLDIDLRAQPRLLLFCLLFLGLGLDRLGQDVDLFVNLYRSIPAFDPFFHLL